jgi:FkbM family methyltransferase
MSKIRIAIVKFGGLSVGGSERYLQVIAANLSRELFDVDYYYCDAAPYLGSSSRHGNTNPDRLKYLQDNKVRLFKFNVQFRDLTKPTFDWVGTDFWEIFDEQLYDLVLTVKSGHPEYPFTLLKIPLVEIVGLPAGIDSQPVFHVHSSQYQRKAWLKMGGDLKKSCVIPPPPTPPQSKDHLRSILNISEDGIVAGFHQRADDAIFSPIPLQSFFHCFAPNRYFVLLGGGQKYRDQARELRLQNVYFLPETGDPALVSQFLNTLDIFAHGRADGETYGAVFAEAMLHGKPCLSHTVSKGDNAQPETMGPSGWFAANLEEYTLKLERLYRDPDLRKFLSQKSISHAQEYFSLDSCLDQLTRLFQKICGRPGNSPQKQRIPYGISPLGFLYSGELDQLNHIAYHVLSGDVPEEYYVHIVRFFLPKVRTFIDIGANTGLYGFVAANECPEESKVHCFEPQPECCQVLKKTVDLNNWEERVFIHPIGLSDQPGELTLHLADSGSSFETAFVKNYSTASIRVPVDTLDNYCRDMRISDIDFIKIDVECFEKKVLEGACEVISKYKPAIFLEIIGIVNEIHFENDCYLETIQWLQSKGYAIYRCIERRGRFCHFGTVSKVTNFDIPNKLSMYLCVSSEKEFEIIGKLKSHLAKVNKTLIKNRISTVRRKGIRLIKEKFKKTSLYPLFYQGRNMIFRSIRKLPHILSRSS